VRTYLAVAVCVLAVICAGCGVLLLGTGAALGAGAVLYYQGRLEQSVDASLEDTHAATVAALKELGLPVIPGESKSQIESKYPDDAHVWIGLEFLGKQQTRVSVRVGLTGDKARATTIMDAIARNLP
jgi:hypothetical protein